MFCENKLMRTKHILVELLDYLEQYEAENPDIDKTLNTTDFIGFLSAHFKSAAIKKEMLNGGENADVLQNDKTNVDTDISILVSTLFRYAKMYIKKGLKDSALNSADEFSFMITLMTHESMTKQELITSQVFEKTSGVEIINRMIRQGFIDQYQDDKDKRSVRLRITQPGRMEIIRVLPQMRQVSQIVAGNLNDREKVILGYLLRKLDHFHNEIYLHSKEEDLDSLIEKVGE